MLSVLRALEVPLRRRWGQPAWSGGSQASRDRPIGRSLCKYMQGACTLRRAPGRCVESHVWRASKQVVRRAWCV